VTELFAVVNNANRVKDNQVIVDIRPPSLALASQGVEAKSALEINELIRMFCQLAVNRIGLVATLTSFKNQVNMKSCTL
jgi:hypothetical protein